MGHPYVLLELLDRIKEWDLETVNLEIAQTSGMELASSSSPPPAAGGLPALEGATELVDGARLGGMLTNIAR